MEGNISFARLGGFQPCKSQGFLRTGRHPSPSSTQANKQHYRSWRTCSTQEKTLKKGMELGRCVVWLLESLKGQKERSGGPDLCLRFPTAGIHYSSSGTISFPHTSPGWVYGWFNVVIVWVFTAVDVIVVWILYFWWKIDCRGRLFIYLSGCLLAGSYTYSAKQYKHRVC